MALCDYHLCIVCGGKAFYDAHGSEDYLEKCDRGEVMALCDGCGKTHRLVAQPRNGTSTERESATPIATPGSDGL